MYIPINIFIKLPVINFVRRTKSSHWQPIRGTHFEIEIAENEKHLTANLGILLNLKSQVKSVSTYSARRTGRWYLYHNWTMCRGFR